MKSRSPLILIKSRGKKSVQIPELKLERSHVYGSLGQVSRERERDGVRVSVQPKFETDEAMRGREGEGEDEFPRQNGVQKKVLLAIRMPTYKLAGREGKGRKEGRTI